MDGVLSPASGTQKKATPSRPPRCASHAPANPGPSLSGPITYLLYRWAVGGGSWTGYFLHLNTLDTFPELQPPFFGPQESHLKGEWGLSSWVCCRCPLSVARRPPSALPAPATPSTPHQLLHYGPSPASWSSTLHFSLPRFWWMPSSPQTHPRAALDKPRLPKA